MNEYNCSSALRIKFWMKHIPYPVSMNPKMVIITKVGFL